MGVIKLTFVTLGKSSHIAFPNKEVPYHVFLSLFQKNYREKESMWVLEAIQQNTPDFLSSLRDFVQANERDHPQFHEVLRFFSALTANHYFIIHKGILTDTALIHQYWDILAKRHQSEGLAYQNYAGGLLPPAIFLTYDLNIYGKQPLKIGQPIKALRVCRFCQGKQGDTNHFGKIVAFKNKAHAISEALGNKSTILLEECDACNERFSVGIELSVIQLLIPYRSFFGLDGKGGKKKLKGTDFSIQSTDEMISIQLEKDIPELSSISFPQPFKVDLNLREGFIPQDVYKSLCKFVLSVIPTHLCSTFSETINWINGTRIEKKLPKIAMLEDNRFFTQIPMLFTYTRKNDTDLIPYMIRRISLCAKYFRVYHTIQRKRQSDFSKSQRLQTLLVELQ
ncbi:hypothetical protein [Mucilaginibacter terrae]|uniref:HNH endonuclease 5 domain-containing protein n=1 Tax=Mucilaginibacter terrae TaxID=1955052 RepID=A0ABU3GN99_9SPHI|nr:hypothetical protein [Mucilaginibacter terrae]MDT3401244.1 hypothetical protein [Mucilaginibacter terrae]